MVEAIEFFSDYVLLVYLALLIGLLFAVRLFLQARRERKEAVFGLELELAHRQHARAVGAFVAIGLLAMAEFILVVFLAPALPALTIMPTPTGQLAGLPTNTIPPEILVTLNASTPGATATLQASGCIPGQVMITSPKPGEQVRRRITIEGTADIPNFGFYKYEFSPSGAELWTTIQAGREPRQEQELGEWDTTLIMPGDYLLRLVVTNNQGEVLPPCVVPVRIQSP